MSTPVGHALAGVAAYLVVRAASRGALPGAAPFLAAAAVAGIAPDLDAILLAVAGPVTENLPIARSAAAAHRGFTHSLAFAAGFGLLSALLARRLSAANRPPLTLLAAAFSGACASHVLLDFLCGHGKGLPILWPLTAHEFQAPFSLLPPPLFGRTASALLALWSEPYWWKVLAVEAAIFGPIAFGAWLASERDRGPHAPLSRLRWPAAAAAVALGAVVAAFQPLAR